MLRTARSLAVVAALLVVVAPGAASAAAPRASLPDIEDEVMCPVCGTPLNLAQDAPLAQRERAFIRARIARGETKGQIKRALAREFGSGVLALPPKKGFDLAAYLVPLAVIAGALAGAAVALARWRRRRIVEPASSAAGELSPADARRLDEDLARYDL